ncbi:transglycosylase domain-containing protein [Yimella sp. cx-51]|uniref:transglycosylase domain-containing protein n=1 Tax=Yimella sp. cx-51 TaxID=2770551 RepID=UPI00165D7F4D|nr:transglycosylase domain-containing protein [Yimella sp. cx-51]MBC9957843.1 penicillin-binding protein [Yimella sp. cx-51]QTH37982.1 penicillin-binding protein [Yimella sp. cx-51]
MSESDNHPETPHDEASPRRARRAAATRRKGRPLWAKVALRTMLGFFVLGLIGFIALVVIYLRTEIPKPNADADKQVSIIYYSDGKTELDRFSSVNREDVQINRVPKDVQHAFLAAEDRNFYDNRGVSVSGIVRALWTNLTGGQQQGGSTITQQYVKNYFLTQDKTVSRKLNEVMISIKLDQKYTKDEILQRYLNNIYFGRNSYGIQAASKTYFNKDVSQLNASEGAFLASVINAPSLFDPAGGKAAAERMNNRMIYVLDGMVTEGWMSPQVRAQQKMPVVQPVKAPTYGSGPTGYLTQTVRNELKNKLKLSDTDIARGGLRITTTIDVKKQRAAEKAVQKAIPADVPSLKDLHAGLVAQKPDGSIVALYGGSDYRKSQWNAATYAAPQAGSTFKVFGTVAALENGYSLNSRFSGASPFRLPGTKPLRNDGGEQFGYINMSTMMQHSVNTSFLRLNQQMGPVKTREAAIKAGIPAGSAGMNDNVTNILGEASVHVSDVANAFSTVSSEGKKADQHIIAKVSSVAGSFSYTAKTGTTQVIDKKVSADVVNSMATVTQPGGTAYRALSRADFTRPSAGKTGTTDGYKAAWYAGFTPNQLTTAVGMYAGDGTKSLAAEGASFYGGEVPATIWADFMNAALEGEPVAKIPEPGRVKGGSVGQVPPPVRQTTQNTPRATSTTTSSSTTSSTTSSSTTSSTTSSTSSSSTSSSSSSTTTAPPSSTTTPPAPSTTTAPPPPASTQPPAPSTQAPAANGATGTAAAVPTGAATARP